MKLSTENIRFIDKYLEHSNFDYKNVRAEIIDHIATDIETQINAGDTRAFYEIFKAYMVEQKPFLLENYSALKKQTDKTIVKTFFKQFFKMKIVGVLIVAITIHLLFFKSFESYKIAKYVVIAPNLFFILITILYDSLLNSYKMNRYFGIKKLIIAVFTAVPFLGLLTVVPQKTLPGDIGVLGMSLIMGIIYVLIAALLTTMHTIILEHSKKYNSLV